MNFPKLSLPQADLRLKHSGEKLQVFCNARKKWIILTPEEWVRQHFMYFLNTELNYPYSLMAVEKEITVHGLKKRFDICCSNTKGELKLLIECKAPEIKLTEDTFNQASRYNLTLKVPFLTITNGVQHFCAEVNLNTNSIHYLPDVPAFNTL